MKYLFTFFFLFHSLLFAGGGPTDEFPPLVISNHEDQASWPLYSIQSGTQNFSIRFPASPSVQLENNQATVLSVDTSNFPAAVYGIRFKREAEPSPDPFQLFEEVLANYSTYPNVLLSHTTFNEEDHYYLDLWTKHIRYEIYRREIVLVTPYNVIHLYTILPVLAPDNSGYFANSFALEDRNEGAVVEQ